VALVLVPLVGKFAGSFLSTIATRIESPFTLATGLMSKGVAEIALLLVLLEVGVIEQSVFSLFVLVMFGYILLMPQAIKLSVKRAKAGHARMPQVVPPSYVRYALSGVKIGSLLDRTRSYPSSDTTVQSFLDDWVVPNHRDYVVVDGGEVAGIVSMPKVRSVSRSARATTTLSDPFRCSTTSPTLATRACAGEARWTRGLARRRPRGRCACRPARPPAAAETAGAHSSLFRICGKGSANGDQALLLLPCETRPQRVFGPRSDCASHAAARDRKPNTTSLDVRVERSVP
jgi:hypothetical protein